MITETTVPVIFDRDTYWECEVDATVEYEASGGYPGGRDEEHTPPSIEIISVKDDAGHDRTGELDDEEIRAIKFCIVGEILDEMNVEFMETRGTRGMRNLYSGMRQLHGEIERMVRNV